MTALLSRTAGGPEVEPPEPSPADRRAGVVLAALAVVASVVVALDAQIPVLRALAGLYLMIALPTYLLLVTKDWSRASTPEAIVYCLAIVLLGVIVVGLAINEALPLLGLARPLDRIPVLLATDVTLVGLGWWRRKRWGEERRLRLRALSLVRGSAALDRRMVIAGLVLVLGVVAGAIRLNNGASGTVTLGALCLAGLLVLALIGWRRRLRPTTVVVTVYLLSVALLLMTSLRGWQISGHDSQLEYYLFQLTHANGVWRLESFQAAYNACLSITILPTMFAEVTGIPGIYVFKVLLQLAFAVCPVIVYLIARRFGSVLVGVLSAVYFVSFPTFFTDMPFLARQEVAFLFLGAILLVATNRRWAVQRRQLWVTFFSVGLVLSHYSTTYVFIGLLVVALLTRGFGAAAARLVATFRRTSTVRERRPSAVLGLANIVVLVALAAVWTGPITHSGGQVGETGSRLTAALFGTADGAQSSDVAYSLFAADQPSGEQRLRDYTTQTIEETAPRRAGEYYPLSTIDRYPAGYVETPELLPLTAVGQALDDAGVDVRFLNSAMRQGAAKLLQVFVFVGFVFVLLRRARGLRVSREFLHLAIAASVVVVSQVMLPSLSVDYGVLRAFQQSLFVLAPFLAVGSVHIFGWLGRRWSVVAATTVAGVFFFSLTGIIPQVLGGYPAQLHLNNAGQYYDLYYSHPEEQAAANWLEAQTLAVGDGTIQTVIANRFLYGPAPTIDAIRAIYPTVVQRDAYVLLGTAAVVKGQGTVFHGGDLLSYTYPTAFLDRTKNLVYSSGRAVIYR
ncbi:DUF2206 domain-containing protein [Pseudonocardia asaccharolytica]|uniref:Uncharacterized protein n=1 Tax=Pseudonocardia asaccharolytica DSM 44247 = NBRC 16224 TaxID=1123024 RepID=A0A511D034_9PSEU|nr:DUF2206 domain-containing protein [Pseudonocardia asaccharolytica]GEL16904.1 hypothetical protein PA7_07410 [Pseudonocardia asaccharolytica DSM 44247 = NBRC 16224]